MVTNAKVTVEDVKKSAASAATTVKAKAASASEATKTAAKAKKEVSTSAVVQYQGMEFSETDCLKKAQAAFKKEYKGKTLEELNIYIKPEERKIYYVANKDCVGSVDL